MQNVDAHRLAAECLATSQPLRWRHVQGVAARADQLRASEGDDPVVAAAWLHDVGYGSTATRTGLHALDGAVFLLGQGVDPLVISLVAFHTGSEFEAEERGLDDDLNAFARPPQNLLDTLILSDLTVTPSGRDTGVAARIAEIVERYHEDDPVHRAVRRSSDYLRACCARAASRTSAEERGIAVF